jgi:hypothetical protein
MTKISGRLVGAPGALSWALTSAMRAPSGEKSGSSSKNALSVSRRLSEPSGRIA